MVMREELLPSEAESLLEEGEVRVKLTLATSHDIPKVGDFSLFRGEEAEGEEPYPEMEREIELNIPIPAVQGAVLPGEEMLVSEYREEASLSAVEETGPEEELFRVLEQIIEDHKPEQEEPEKGILRCEGVMKRRHDDIVICYNEEDNSGMGETKTEIVLHGGRSDMVSIIRTGAVRNTLICEKGRRHISVYNTPVMPFQVCVIARECEQNVTMEDGGTVYMNYYLELRGTEMQHSKMRITVKVAE